METTFVLTPGSGHGNGKRYKPSAAAVRDIKQSRVTIKNNNLCCARAIVTKKALVNRGAADADYKNMLRG